MRWQIVLGFVAVSAATVSASCVIVEGDGGDDAGETTMVGDGDGDPGDGDPGDGDPGDGDPGDGDGDGDGEPGDGDGDGDPGDGDGDGDPNCPPGDPDGYFSYEPFEFGGDPRNVDLDWTCTATEVDVSDGLYLLLDCPDATMPITIDISATPSFLPPVFPDDTVHVRYVYEGPWWFNIYLRIDVEGYGHLLTMIDGDSLLPPDNYAFELPFPIQPVSGLCAPRPDSCGDLERLALAFEVDGESVEMLDSNYAIVGGDPGTDVWVAHAGHLHDIVCTDTPDEWYRVLIANTGWE
jgi:hypothetical protein